MPFVFLASQCGRRLPSDPTSRRRPCLGLVVILMYLLSHESEPPTGDLHPMNSRPCRAYTTGWSLTLATLAQLNQSVSQVTTKVLSLAREIGEFL